LIDLGCTVIVHVCCCM